MSMLRHKLSKYSILLDTEKLQIKQSIEKMTYLRDFLKDLHHIISQIISGYKRYGKRHQLEFETLDDYKNSLYPQVNLSKVLSLVSSYTKLIADFYIKKCDNELESIQHKQKKITFEIENFSLSCKLKMYSLLEDLTRSISDLNNLDIKREECVRQEEVIKKLIQNIELNIVKPDQKLEKICRENEITKHKETLLLDEKISELEENIEKKTLVFKDNFQKILEVSAGFESKCIETIQFFMASTSALLINLLEFRKTTSGKLNLDLEAISLKDSDQNLLNSPLSEQDMLRTSSFKLEILSKIKASLMNIAESENNMLEDYFSYIKTFFSKNETDLSLYSSGCLEDIQESIKIQKKISEEIFINIVKPIETLIRVQTSLNSSLELSIKNISKNFKKTAEHYLSSPNRESSFSKCENENLPFRVLKFKEYQSKEIKSLLNSHINKENSYLSSIKNALALIHEQNLRAYQEVNTLLSASNYSYKPQSRSKSSFKALTGCKEHPESPIKILKIRGRNAFEQRSIKKTTDDEEYRNRFDLENREPVIESFLCAYKDGILLQGKMYITASFIAFYSYFNNLTILGRETVLKIPISEISKVYKEKTVFIFDTSLSVWVGKREYFFTSFLSRDEAYNQITKLMTLQNNPVQKPNLQVPISIENRKFRLDISACMKKINNPFSSMFPDSYFTEELFDPEILLDAPIEILYQKIFSDSSSFHKKYIEATGDEFLELTPWSSPPPDFYLSQPGSSWPASANRVIKVQHKLKERLPLMPVSCLLVENQTIYFLSQEKFIIDSELEVRGPYGEYFNPYMRTIIEKNERVSIRMKYGIVFKSYTIFKGKITKEGIKESFEALNKIWKPMVLKSISCEKLEEFYQTPAPKSETQTSCQWEHWGIILVLILVVVKLYFKVKMLELELARIKT